MYSNLLEHYATNSARTNHYILSFMMRLSNFTVSVGYLFGPRANGFAKDGQWLLLEVKGIQILL